MRKNMNSKIAEYIDYIKLVKHHSQNTCSAYEQDLNRFHSFLVQAGIEEYERVNDTLLNSYILQLEKENLSPSTISRNVVVIKKFFSFLFNNRIIQSNPTESIRGPKTKHQLPTVLSIEQINTLLNLPDVTTRIGIRDKAIFELLYGTGIKASEIISLTLSDVNFNYNILTCRNAKKERLIPFGKQASLALKHYLAEGRDLFLSKEATDILFLSQQGCGLTRQGFWKIIKGYGTKLGLSDINPQMLRHSFAMHLIENGANVATVGEMLGYADSSQAYGYIAAQNSKVREEYMKAHPRA